MTTQSQAYSPPAASCIPDERALRRAPKDRVLSSLSKSQTCPLRIAALGIVRRGRIDHALCPRNRLSATRTRAWACDLEADCNVIAVGNTCSLPTLFEADERTAPHTRLPGDYRILLRSREVLEPGGLVAVMRCVERVTGARGAMVCIHSARPAAFESAEQARIGRDRAARCDSAGAPDRTRPPRKTPDARP